jgi:hypothetical protein
LIGRAAARETPYCRFQSDSENGIRVRMPLTGSQTPGRTPPLSLQDKLDHISHERDVLALLRELARQGLGDGDAVRHRVTGERGVLSIVREPVPHAVVLLDNGGQGPFEAEIWQPIAG